MPIEDRGQDGDDSVAIPAGQRGSWGRDETEVVDYGAHNPAVGQLFNGEICNTDTKIRRSFRVPNTMCRLCRVCVCRR